MKITAALLGLVCATSVLAADLPTRVTYVGNLMIASDTKATKMEVIDKDLKSGTTCNFSSLPQVFGCSGPNGVEGTVKFKLTVHSKTGEITIRFKATYANGAARASSTCRAPQNRCDPHDPLDAVPCNGSNCTVMTNFMITGR